MDLTITQLEQIFAEYIAEGRSVYIENPQNQGNSKLWEKDVEEFLIVDKKLSFRRSDGKAPDFGSPLNFDLKMIKDDRKSQTFSLSGLSVEEANTGNMPYRLAIVIWEYDAPSSCGHAVEAIIIPPYMKEYLSQWSFTGIQIKTGVNRALIEKRGIIYNGGRMPTVFKKPDAPVQNGLF
jgi:hypothetical protein